MTSSLVYIPRIDILYQCVQKNFYPDTDFTGVFIKLWETDTKFIVNYGGSGSSKSVSSAQCELIRIAYGKGHTLVFRKTGSSVEDSIFEEYKETARQMDCYNDFTWYNSKGALKAIHKKTGNKILFKGLDSPEKIKSIKGVRRIVLEEASEFEFNDFKELIRRARGVKDIQFTLNLNPIDQEHWVKVKVIDSGAFDGDLTVIKSTYKDNQFLTNDDVAEYERLKILDPEQYRIYALAEWGILKTQNPFAWAFERNKHVGVCDYDPSLELILAFDFNVSPITCVAMQIDELSDPYKIRVLRSIGIENSNIYELCERIIAYYPDAIFKVTGDATGKNRSAMVKDNLNYYKIIRAELMLAKNQIKLPTVNPKIGENSFVVNSILNKCDVVIDEQNAPELIYDLQYVEVGPDKKIIKDRTAENRKADYLDCFRYGLNTYCKNIIKEMFKGKLYDKLSS